MRAFVDIRARLLLAALLPLLVVSTVLVSVLLLARLDDMQQSYDQRNRSVASQVALASEYGLFSVNQSQLQAIAQGGLRQADVRWVAIVDGGGQMLASAGDPGNGLLHPMNPLATQGFDVKRRLDWFTQPVFAGSLEIDDLFEKNTLIEPKPRRQLGQVVLVFSRHAVDRRAHEMLLAGGLISLLGLIFGMALAIYLSRGVMRPIQRITQLTERIGRGDFEAVSQMRQHELTREPLQALQSDIYRMADRLSVAREDLEQQVHLATQALLEKKNEAENANRAKSHFLAAASHDLRQPTHALGLFVSRLAQLPHDAQTGALIDNLEASVRAMQHLLDGLLDISRLDAQAVQVNKRPFPLSVLLHQLTQDLAQVAQEKGLRLRIRQTDYWVMSDDTLLYRILLNLVDNALNYTERGGVLVAVRPVYGTGLVRLQVWDSGIGIAPEHQTAVFAEFYQVANPGRDRTKGLGLGLNIVQRKAALLGHPLQLASHLGRGTRFTLTLPTVAADLDAPALPALETTSSQELFDVLALVIEDDLLVRSALCGLLQGWGLRVIEARGLSEALEKVADGTMPDVIISDYRLHDEHDGIAVIGRLRSELGSSIAACLVSGDTDASVMRSARAAGLTLLHKPVRPAKLRSLLRNLLQVQSGSSLVDLS